MQPSRTRTRGLLRRISLPEPAHTLFRPPFRDYQLDGAYDEMFEARGFRVRITARCFKLCWIYRPKN